MISFEIRKRAAIRCSFFYIITLVRVDVAEGVDAGALEALEVNADAAEQADVAAPRSPACDEQCDATCDVCDAIFYADAHRHCKLNLSS